MCNNAQGNALAISALVDGDVNLGDSIQDGSQLNNCDDGEVTCDNAGINQLLLTADGANAETNLETNTQTSSQTNDCDTTGNTCANALENSFFELAFDDAVISISDNTQTGTQSNDCTSTFVDTTCSNVGNVGNVVTANLFEAQATDASTIIGSNIQTANQANTCSDALCTNAGAQINHAVASGFGSVNSERYSKR